MNIKHTATRIVEATLNELRGRKGIRQALEDVDDDVMLELCRELETVIGDILFEEECT